MTHRKRLLAILLIGCFSAGIVSAKKKERLILEALSFEAGRINRTSKVRFAASDVAGLGARIEVHNDPGDNLAYIEITRSGAESSRFALPRSNGEWHTSAAHLYVRDDGTVVIPGNELDPEGYGTIPCLWTWEPGDDPTTWKQWILDARDVIRRVDFTITSITYVVGVDYETGDLLCVAVKDGRHVGLARFAFRIKKP